MPEEGGTLWTDNMTIPITATNPVDAIMLMDYFYQVEVAATLAEYINYITPVPAAQQAIQQHAAGATGEDKAFYEALATSPLVFPSEGRLRQGALLPRLRHRLGAAAVPEHFRADRPGLIP